MCRASPLSYEPSFLLFIFSMWEGHSHTKPLFNTPPSSATRTWTRTHAEPCRTRLWYHVKPLDRSSGGQIRVGSTSVITFIFSSLERIRIHHLTQKLSQCGYPYKPSFLLFIFPMWEGHSHTKPLYSTCNYWDIALPLSQDENCRLCVCVKILSRNLFHE